MKVSVRKKKNKTEQKQRTHTSTGHVELILVMVEGFECPNEPKSYVVEGNTPLVGPLKAKWLIGPS